MSKTFKVILFLLLTPIVLLLVLATFNSFSGSNTAKPAPDLSGLASDFLYGDDATYSAKAFGKRCDAIDAAVHKGQKPDFRMPDGKPFYSFSFEWKQCTTDASNIVESARQIERVVGSGKSEPPIPEILSRFVFSGKFSSRLR